MESNDDSNPAPFIYPTEPTEPFESSTPSDAPIPSEPPIPSGPPEPTIEKPSLLPAKQDEHLFLCVNCKSCIPFITIIQNDPEFFISGTCPSCGYSFEEEELYSYMNKVYAIEKKDSLNLQQYYKCKTHEKDLNSICIKCNMLSCEDCLKEYHHDNIRIKESTQWNYDEEECKKKKTDYIQFINKLKNYFPAITNNEIIHESYNKMLRRINGQVKLITSLLNTNAQYRDNVQMKYNMYYLSFLYKYNLDETLKKISASNLNGFLYLMSILNNPFEYVSFFYLNF